MAGAVDPEGTARAYLETSATHAATLAGGDLPRLVAEAGAVMGAALRRGGRVLFCGNGGSAADAQHLAAELVGRLDAARERGPLAGIALTTDSSVMTSLANDYGYEDVFARQVVGVGRPDDVLVAISTSGRSENVLRAAKTAKEHGLAVIALVGPGDSPIESVADVTVHLPGETSGHVQQGHITVGHAMCMVAEAAAST